MGNGDVNAELHAHRNSVGNETEYYLTLHLGLTGLHTPSPMITQAQYDDLKTEAGVSQSAFDQEAEQAFGDWYKHIPPKFRPGQAKDTKVIIRNILDNM